MDAKGKLDSHIGHTVFFAWGGGTTEGIVLRAHFGLEGVYVKQEGQRFPVYVSLTHILACSCDNLYSEDKNGNP